MPLLNTPIMNHAGINSDWEGEPQIANPHGERILQLLAKAGENGNVPKMGLDVSLFNIEGELVYDIERDTGVFIKNVRASMLQIMLTSGAKSGEYFIIESDPEKRMLQEFAEAGQLILVK